MRRTLPREKKTLPVEKDASGGEGRFRWRRTLPVDNYASGVSDASDASFLKGSVRRRKIPDGWTLYRQTGIISGG